MNEPYISTLKLRIETAEKIFIKEMVNVGSYDGVDIYVKDYDVFLFENEGDFFKALSDAARIAKDVLEGEKFIHLSLQYKDVRLSPDILRTIADSGCTLEIAY